MIACQAVFGFLDPFIGLRGGCHADSPGDMKNAEPFRSTPYMTVSLLFIYLYGRER